MKALATSGGPVHLADCACGFSGICPWDRYCAACGSTLSEGFSISERISVGRDHKAVAVTLENRSKVVVTVHALPFSREEHPPDWLDYNPSSQGAWDRTLQPGEVQTVSYGIRQDVLESMLLEQQSATGISTQRGGRYATSYRLILCADSDYTQQDHVVVLSLSGQADLRPSRIEFPMFPIYSNHHDHRIHLPFSAYNASGQVMHVHDVTICAVSAHPTLGEQHATGHHIIEALFPPDVFSHLRGKRIGPGEKEKLDITSRPVSDTLATVTAQLSAPLYDDPYWRGQRFRDWYWRWPTLVRLRFVIEATLRSDSGDDNAVRSLVAVTLVRPPTLRDASPDDALWKVVEATGGAVPPSGNMLSLPGQGTLTVVADLTNESAIPLKVKEVQTGASWMSVVEAPTEKILPPGASTHIKIKIDPAKRSDEELHQQLLKGKVMVLSDPPLMEDGALEAIEVRTDSTLVIPGCLGIDFGTSNCSVCFLPGADWDDNIRRDLNIQPVELHLESLEGAEPATGMPSILWRHYHIQGRSAPNAFAYGTEAIRLWKSRPTNVRRAIKRILSTSEEAHRFEADSVAEAVVEVPTAELANHLVTHVIHQAHHLAATHPTLSDQLQRIAREAETRGLTGFPPAARIGEAQAYRFERVVFTHPVDAGDNLRRLLFEAAKSAGLARRKIPDGREAHHTFDSFEAECMVDEATAAMTMFVEQFKELLHRSVPGQGKLSLRKVPGAGGSNRLLIVCLDIGGGTTDISVMHYLPRVLSHGADGTTHIRRQLHLLNRAGINDFAGEDLDLAIVEEIVTPKLEEKLRKRVEGAVLLREEVRRVLRGTSAHQIADMLLLNRRVPPGEQAEAMASAVVEGAHLLRDAAEDLKKRASEQGIYTLRLDHMPPFADGARTVSGLDEPDFQNVSLSVTLPEVGKVIRRRVQDRLNEVDRALRMANVEWKAVDVLLFTGQTTRSSTVRDAVLEHVHRLRQNTKLRFLAEPPADLPIAGVHGAASPADMAPGNVNEQISGRTSPYAEQVLWFDPKICVPGGAAIYGSTGVAEDRLEVVLPKRSSVNLKFERSSISTGAPLPCFAKLDDNLAEGDASHLIAFYYVNSKQVTVTLDHRPEDVECLSLALVEPRTAYIIGSRTTYGPSDEPQQVPFALQVAIRALSAERAQELGIDANAPLWWTEAPLPPSDAPAG